MAVDVETFDLVVGGAVDFGTSYTGIAHAYVSDPDPSKIEVITEWPGIGRSQQPVKAPTEISYQDPPRWGYDIKDDMPRYSWFKLHLDLEAGEKAYNDSTLSTTMEQIGNSDHTIRSMAPGKTATDMSADYMKLVYEHSMRTIKLTRMDLKFDTRRIKFVITTPAMWSPAAQDATWHAARRAGFGSRVTDRLDMVSEPEAAANYILKTLDMLCPNMSDAAGWEVGNQIMICDAGGGTVDIVVYEIRQIKPFLRVAETIRPQGGLCGAVAIDCAFQNLLAKRLGDQANLLTQVVRSRGSLLMNSFDIHKREFGSSLEYPDSTEYAIQHGIDNLVPIPEHSITKKKFILTQRDLKDIFDPTVNNILHLVRDVADQARKAAPSKPLLGIVLVGGFGDSDYLYDKLRYWALSQKPQIFMPRPRDSWACIAKGAVAYGLNSLHLDQRRLTCHYGVHLNIVYNPLYHNFEDTYVDAFNKSRYSSDTILWFAKMNDTIEIDKRIQIPVNIRRTVMGGTVPLQLVTCRYNEAPKSRKDTRVVKLRPLSIPLANVPKSAYSRREISRPVNPLLDAFFSPVLGVALVLSVVLVLGKNLGPSIGFYSFIVAIFTIFTISFFSTRKKYVYRTECTLEMVIESASLRFEVRHAGVLIRAFRLGELQTDD